MKKMLCFALVALLLAGCASAPLETSAVSVETVQPTSTPSPVPTASPAPTPSPVPTPTATPDDGKITVDDIGVYVEAPEIVYSTTAEQNGRADELMYADGSISRFFTAQGYEAFEFVSQYGSIAILNVVTSAGWSDLVERDGVRVYFSYMGFSSVMNMAAGCYYGVIPLDARLDEIPNSIALGYLASGGEVG